MRERNAALRVRIVAGTSQHTGAGTLIVLVGVVCRRTSARGYRHKVKTLPIGCRNFGDVPVGGRCCTYLSPCAVGVCRRPYAALDSYARNPFINTSVNPFDTCERGMTGSRCNRVGITECVCRAIVRPRIARVACTENGLRVTVSILMGFGTEMYFVVSIVFCLIILTFGAH